MDGRVYIGAVQRRPSLVTIPIDMTDYEFTHDMIFAPFRCSEIRNAILTRGTQSSYSVLNEALAARLKRMPGKLEKLETVLDLTCGHLQAKPYDGFMLKSSCQCSAFMREIHEPTGH